VSGKNKWLFAGHTLYSFGFCKSYGEKRIFLFEKYSADKVGSLEFVWALGEQLYGWLGIKVRQFRLFYFGTKRNAKRSHFPTSRTKTNTFNLIYSPKNFFVSKRADHATLSLYGSTKPRGHHRILVIFIWDCSTDVCVSPWSGLKSRTLRTET
jgi:hypothetical protein